MELSLNGKLIILKFTVATIFDYFCCKLLTLVHSHSAIDGLHEQFKLFSLKRILYRFLLNQTVILYRRYSIVSKYSLNGLLKFCKCHYSSDTSMFALLITKCLKGGQMCSHVDMAYPWGEADSVTGVVHTLVTVRDRSGKGGRN